MVLVIHIYIYLVKCVCTIIISAPIMANEVAKLLYHCTYLSPLSSLARFVLDEHITSSGKLLTENAVHEIEFIDN